MSRATLVFALGLAILLTGLPTASSEETTAEVVTVATTAPRKSAWGKVLVAWKQEVASKTDGKLRIRLLFDSKAGDEKTVIGKMRDGKLGGALLSGRGLTEVHQPIAALSMPGLFEKPAELNAALAEVLPGFKAGARKDGFVIGGLGAVGVVRMLSKGKPIQRPAELGTMKVFRWTHDVVAPIKQQVLDYTGVPSSIPGILPAVSSGRINVLEVTSLEALQLQWWAHMDHLHTQPVAVDVTGLVFSRSRVKRLPKSLKRVLLTTAKKWVGTLSERLCPEDAKAFSYHKKRMTLVERSDEDRAEWRAEYAEVRKQLRGTVFTEALVDQLESLAAI